MAKSLTLKPVDLTKLEGVSPKNLLGGPFQLRPRRPCAHLQNVCVVEEDVKRNGDDVGVESGVEGSNRAVGVEVWDEQLERGTGTHM
jgi:hypothetical protein